MVLLKNDGGLLPLSRDLKIALVGPHLNSTVALLSNYAGPNKQVVGHTIEAAFRAVPGLTIVGSTSACDIVHGCHNADLASVTAAAVTADVVVAFVGLYPASGTLPRQAQCFRVPLLPRLFHHTYARASIQTHPCLLRTITLQLKITRPYAWESFVACILSYPPFPPCPPPSLRLSFTSTKNRVLPPPPPVDS